MPVSVKCIRNDARKTLDMPILNVAACAASAHYVMPTRRAPHPTIWLINRANLKAPQSICMVPTIHDIIALSPADVILTMFTI